MLNIQSQRYQLNGVAISMQGGRPENQDDLGWVDTPLGFLLVVCDGMGGGPGGKTASYIVKTVFLTEMFNSSPQASCVEALKRAVSRADDALTSKMEEQPQLKGMGSTLVAVLINHQSAFVVHLGDSRCYQIRSGRVVFRTQDHSLVGELVKNKSLTEEQARTSPQSNIIMRGLGNTRNHVPEIEEIPFRDGDRLLLCTDGVWGIMPHEELVQRLTFPQDLSSLVGNLSAEIDQRGRAAGGHHDNFTLAAIELHMNSKLRDKMDKYAKILIAVLAVLLVVSLGFNLAKGGGSAGNEQVEQLNAAIQEKDKQIAQLESYQKISNDISQSGSKELITRVEVLEYEKASLQEYIDELVGRIEELEKQVAKKDAPAKGTATAQSSKPKKTVQQAIDCLNRIKRIEGKNKKNTLSDKSKCRYEAVALLNSLNKQTNGRFKSTIDGVIRELEHKQTETLLVSQDRDKKFVSTLPAKQKIDQLCSKLEKIKEKL